jgi:hypothetical protein
VMMAASLLMRPPERLPRVREALLTQRYATSELFGGFVLTSGVGRRVDFLPI